MSWRNPATVRLDFAAGQFEVDALELASEFAELPDPGSPIWVSTVRDGIRRAGGPNVTDDEAIALPGRLSVAVKEIVRRNTWLVELAWWFRPLNVFALQPWQARLMYAAARPVMARSRIEDAAAAGVRLDITTTYGLLRELVGDEQAQEILIDRIADEGPPEQLRGRK